MTRPLTPYSHHSSQTSPVPQKSPPPPSPWSMSGCTIRRSRPERRHRSCGKRRGEERIWRGLPVMSVGLPSDRTMLRVSAQSTDAKMGVCWQMSM